MLYRFACSLLRLYLMIFNRWEIEGRENLPKQGSVVLTANHTSLWDPIILGCSVYRTVHYMAKDELFRVPVFKWILPRLECFPVKRGRVDRNALRLAADYLEKGEVLGLFPEGTRSRTGSLLPFQHGAALFALRSQAPLVPVGITGAGTVFPFTLRGKIRVRIGKPLNFPEIYGQKIGEEQLEKVSGALRDEISRLIL